ncbi:putative ATP-grasp-modified RiPP [Yinghuangia sp. YIM S10712]|uniref:putative ATP-grasp-modified RiPP n=1 Tax=Yinghuangia sp. YIM S10712 TaxID=3436930 RepID=UPI003F53A16C
MFNYADRVPQGSPLPTGALTPVPWGVRRMAPYPVSTEGYARVEIDHESQVATYFDGRGHVMEMPRHGTSSGTNPPTSTGNPSDGRRGGGENPDTGNDTDQ